MVSPDTLQQREYLSLKDKAEYEAWLERQRTDAAAPLGEQATRFASRFGTEVADDASVVMTLGGASPENKPEATLDTLELRTLQSGQETEKMIGETAVSPAAVIVRQSEMPPWQRLDQAAVAAPAGYRLN